MRSTQQAPRVVPSAAALSGLLLPVALWAHVAFGPPALAAEAFRPGRVLVKLDENVSPRGARTGLPEVDAVLVARGATAARLAFRLDWRTNAALKRRHGLDRILAVELPHDAPVEEIARELADLPGVVFAETDAIGRGGQVPPDDTHYPDQWHLNNGGQTGGVADADIDAPEGWALGTGSPAILLAVLDTGIDSAHPEFAGRILPGWDFVNNDSDPEADHPHGTEVAGIALASANNSFQVAGVDWSAALMPLKVLDANNLGMTSHLVAGILYAADHGADVINMSLIRYPCSGSLRNALQYARDAGVILVSAAGNDGLGDADVSGPGCIPETISVGATNWHDRRASFSGTGSALDVVAPGDGVRTVQYHSYVDGFWNFSGTSASAPVVAGVASLVLALDSTLTPDEVRALIESNADDRVGSPTEDLPERDDRHGWGRVNLRETLAAVTPASLRRGMVLPRTLGVGSAATFSVVYTSSAGNPPDVVRLVLDGPLSGIFAMARSAAGHPVLVDGDFTNGERYEATVMLGSTGTYRYHFESAELSVAARHPLSGERVGPRVTLVLAEDVAVAESSVASATTAGNYTSTHVLDDATEDLDEVDSGGPPSQRTSTLDHRFRFEVSGGDNVTFHVNAGRVVFWPAEDDRYDFSYSTNGGTSWNPMLTVTATDPGDDYQTFVMSTGAGGTIFVRVEDTNSTPGNLGNDRLFVDHMFFRSAAAPTPGEARDLRVTGFDQLTGEMALSWSPACGATDHNLVFGPLAAVATYGYTGQLCGIGTSSTSGFDPGPGSFFFLVVGAAGGGVEGPYGTDSLGRERPEQTADPSCPTTQDLTHRCD